MAKYFGFNPPFIGGPQNVLSRQEDVQLIQNDVLQLVLTLPGERVMRPGFGTILRALVFETMTPNDLALAQDNITKAIIQYEPRVTVDSVILQQDTDKHRLYFTIVMRLRDDPNVQITVDRFIKDTGTTEVAR